MSHMVESMKKLLFALVIVHGLLSTSAADGEETGRARASDACGGARAVHIDALQSMEKEPRGTFRGCHPAVQTFQAQSRVLFTGVAGSPISCRWFITRTR